jgi:hypothetical protein
VEAYGRRQPIDGFPERLEIVTQQVAVDQSYSEYAVQQLGGKIQLRG